MSFQMYLFYSDINNNLNVQFVNFSAILDSPNKDAFLKGDK